MVSGWPFDRAATIKIAAGFGVAILLVYLLGVVVGWDETIARLRQTDPLWFGAAAVSTVLSIVVWAWMWRVVLDSIGVRVSLRRIVVTFLAGTFVNYITPMGQAGGQPFIAYVLAQDTTASYEQSLASVVTADILRLFPYFNAGLLGIGYLVLRVSISEQTRIFVVGIVGLAVLLPALIVGAWWYRQRVRSLLLWAAQPIVTRTDRLTIAGLAERIDRLYTSLDRISTSPWSLLIAIVLAYVGWVFFALPLYFAGVSLGVSIPLLLICFLIPATIIAGLLPSPGGLAAIEGTLVVLLTALTAVSADQALAITTVYRVASYWLVILIGGVGALWVLRRI